MPPAADHSVSKSRALVVLGALMLVLLAVVPMLPGLHGPFIYDDLHAVAENPYIQQLWPIEAPPSSSFTARPVSSLSMSVNYAVTGGSAPGFRAGNLLLHAINALLLWFVIYAALQTFERPRQLLHPAAAVWAIAALWAVHPLQTEPVLYITQRTELMVSLCILGMLAALALAGRLDRDQTTNTKRWRVQLVLVVSVLLCGAGMASKEIMVGAPLLALLYDRTFIAGSFSRALKKRWLYYAALASTCGVLIWLQAASPHAASAGLDAGVAPWDYLKTQANVIVMYLRLSVLPLGQSIHHEFALGPSLSQVAAAGAAILVLLGATIYALVRRPVWGFIGAAFFLILAPTSSVLPIVTEPAAERRMYLPLACVLAAVVLVAVSLLRRKPNLAQAGKWLMLPVLVILLSLTFHRAQLYADDRALWADAAVHYPDSSSILTEQGRLAMQDQQWFEASQYFEHALKVAPNHANAHTNIALIYARTGDPELLQSALEHAQQAAKLEPQSYKIWNNLGTVFGTMQQPGAAAQAFEEALKRAPWFTQARLNLAIALQKQGKQDAAREHLKIVLEQATQRGQTQLAQQAQRYLQQLPAAEQ